MTDAEKIAPYLGAVTAAADEYAFDRALVAAMGFRETDFGHAPGYAPKGSPAGTGDAGHGHGLFQIDDRTFGDWLRGHAWGDPLTNARQACSILRNDRSYLRALVTMPGVSDDLFLRTVFAAYNAGPSRARRGVVLTGDPDQFTASRRSDKRGDYSAWIWAKAADLRVQIPTLKENPNVRAS